MGVIRTVATVDLLYEGAVVVSRPLTHAGDPDLDLVDALARGQLAAARIGCRLRLRNPDPHLAQLLELVGLADLLLQPPATRADAPEDRTAGTAGD